MIMFLYKLLKTFYYTKIRGYHKHNFERVKDVTLSTKMGKFTFQQHKCKSCIKTLALEDWQIRDLPSNMQYTAVAHI